MGNFVKNIALLALAIIVLPFYVSPSYILLGHYFWPSSANKVVLIVAELLNSY